MNSAPAFEHAFLVRARSYAERAARFAAEAEAFGARSRRLSNFRGLSFGVFAVAALYAVFGSAPLVGAGIAAAGLIAFVALVRAHANVMEQEDEALRWCRVNRDAEVRVNGRFTELPQNGARFVDAEHVYTSDLDVFGPASLYQRISVAHTHFGEERLAQMLREPAETRVVLERQAAVRALAEELDVRQRIESLALALTETPAGSRLVDGPRHVRPAPDPEKLLEWAESKPSLLEHAPLIWAARVLPIVTFALMLLGSRLGAPWLWLLPFVLQSSIVFRTRDITTRVFVAVSATEGAFLRYDRMLAAVESIAPRGELLASLHARLTQGGGLPSEAMREFRRAVGWFDLRHNGMIHPLANLFLCWDLHSTVRLERWQAKVGKRLRDWFQVLGEVEALSSFAGLAADEPEFAFAEVVAEPSAFDAEGLAHPLVPAGSRVPNDVTLAGPGHALLVTGSNMSGKSTLLRAMGLAVVLGLAGAPACARRLRIGNYAVRTSVRVSDSLERGVSHFYAEVAKLRRALEATEGERKVFFLLDEILHGTNSRERVIGARWVVAELLRRGALGAVSTHDLELARVPPELEEQVTLVHLRETVSGSQMTFDYRVRPGPVTAGNALRLMRQIGLDVPLG
jgi:hypothetical protein